MEGEQQQGSEQQQEPQQQVTEDMVTMSKAELDRKFSKARKNAQAETEARIRREYAARGGNEQEQRREPEKPAELKEPKRDQEPWASMTYEDYLDARADYVSKKSGREERERVSKEETARQAAEREREEARTFKKHADALLDELPDFAEVIEDATEVMISEAMGAAMKAAGPLGPRILYYLAKNPQESQRIFELKSTPAQAREIGKIEAKLETEIAAKKKPKEGEQEQEQEQRQEQRPEGERDGGGRFKAQEKESRKAPEPIEPGSGRSANMDRGPSDKDTDSDWFAKRLAQEKSDRERQRRK